MRVFSTILVAAGCLAACAPGRAVAQSYVASVQGTSCTATVSGSESVRTGCATLLASAGPGGVGAAAQAFFIITSDSVLSDPNPSAWASASDWIRVPGLTSGTIELEVQVGGSIRFEHLLPNTNSWVAQSASVGAGVNDVGFSYSAGFDSISGQGWTMGPSPSQLGIARIPVIDGYAAVTYGVNVRAYCGLSLSSGVDTYADCRSIASYASTLRILGAVVLDEHGEVRDDVTLESDSGFDYRTGLPPNMDELPPMVFSGGGSVFGMTEACGPLFGTSAQAVTLHYTPSEGGEPPSGLSIVWPTGAEHLSLWGEMVPGPQFLGGAGRASWTRFVFYPLRPLIRVVDRRILLPRGGTDLALAQELLLRLRVQNFASTSGCSATIVGVLQRG